MSRPLTFFRRHAWTTAAIALVALKLWLVGAQSIFALGFASHDDALFINRAQDLLDGNWLGPYHQLTLAHAPMYPLFIAGTWLLHVPLFTAQQLLYAAGCAALVQALRPLLARAWVAWIVFAILLFNPVTFDTAIHGRVLRQDILPGLTLLVLAGFMGFIARPDARVSHALPWLVLSAVALPAFWLTRNESVWLLPCLGLLVACGAIIIWRRPATGRLLRLSLLILVPFSGWAAGIATVSTINWRVYGVFTTTEFKQRDFNDAYGALSRIEPARWRQFIHVPREVRERLYPLSPAFAELQPHLEGELGLAWAGISETVHHIPAAEREIGAGWFMWTLRDAVTRAGHGGSAGEVANYYRRLAHEINQACERGRIAAGPRRSGFVPPLRREHLVPFKESVIAGLRMVMTFDQMAVRSEPSAGSPEELARFAKLTRGRLSPPAGESAEAVWLEPTRLAVLDAVRAGYATIAPWAGAASLLACPIALGLALRRRVLPFFAVLAVACAASVAALVAIVALVNATSFPALNTGYLSGSYGLWLLCCVSGWLALGEVVRPRAG